MDYEDFLASKLPVAPAAGIQVDTSTLHPRLFDFQRAIVEWTLHRGQAGIFSDCGTGKTAMELEWSRQIGDYTRGRILTVAPLAVANQTIKEAALMGIEVRYVKRQSDVKGPGIWITNYDRIEDFTPEGWNGVVLDESGILRNYTGKIKQRLVDFASSIQFLLAATATPAPNDYMELGNHADFLRVMPSSEMLARWFINDTMHFGNYRLKGHAVKPFWEWVASWAVCMGTPSDLGFSDEGYILPPLNIQRHIIDADLTVDAGENLFRKVEMSATSMHREMRLTAADRAHRVADLVNPSPDDCWIVWCQTNYEADELKAAIPGAIEVRGSEPLDRKERLLTAFSAGEERVLITKPSIAGYGLNWQHCHNVAFVGMSYSYDNYYQAVRRCWRFGQKNPVNCHIIMADTEAPVFDAVQRKQAAHLEMQRQMYRAVNSLSTAGRKSLRLDCGDTPMMLPPWLTEAGLLCA